jgi:hypothetical protein
VSFENHGSFMVKECRILICRCLLKMLEVDGFIWHVHIFNINKKFLSILFHIAHCKIYEFWKVFSKIQKNLETTKTLYIHQYHVFISANMLTPKIPSDQIWVAGYFGQLLTYPYFTTFRFDFLYNPLKS